MMTATEKPRQINKTPIKCKNRYDTPAVMNQEDDCYRGDIKAKNESLTKWGNCDDAPAMKQRYRKGGMDVPAERKLQ